MEREFRNVLAEFLKDNGISQTAFAKATGVKQSQVAEWLIGKNCPNAFPSIENPLTAHIFICRHTLQSSEKRYIQPPY